jgi:hypothetical protein
VAWVMMPVVPLVCSIRCDPLLILYHEVNGQGRIAGVVIPTDNYDGPAGIVVHQFSRVCEEPPFFQCHGVPVHVGALLFPENTEG